MGDWDEGGPDRTLKVSSWNLKPFSGPVQRQGTILKSMPAPLVSSLFGAKAVSVHP